MSSVLFHFLLLLSAVYFFKLVYTPSCFIFFWIPFLCFSQIGFIIVSFTSLEKYRAFHLVYRHVAAIMKLDDYYWLFNAVGSLKITFNSHHLLILLKGIKVNVLTAYYVFFLAVDFWNTHLLLFEGLFQKD